MNFRLLLIPLVAGLVLPQAGWTQASGEAAATPEQAATTEVDTQPLQRSALWRTIDAHHRQHETETSVHDRRLSREERLELREQLRQAWYGTDVQQATAAVAAGVSDQP